jgi:hypothetical protein
LKLVEVEVNQHVIVPWEAHVLLQIMHPLGLLNLLPYILRKFDSFDDFKAKLAIY